MIYIFFIGIAIISGILLTIAIRAYAVKYNIVNKPNPIVPQHLKPVAYLGGGAIFLGILICSGLAFFLQETITYNIFSELKPVAAIACGCVLYLAWGIYDDLKQLKPLPKFLGQLFFSIVCVSLGIHTKMFGLPFMNYSFSIFWILFIVNALNFTDVCDGLVASICAITFFLIGILSHESKIFSFIIAGATTGFLFFNLPRASIFLGDAGSHMLGFLLAATAIMGSEKFSAVDSIIWMLFISIVPVFELLFITITRIKKGKQWWKGSPDHFSLRMQSAGFKRWQVDIIAAFISAVFVAMAYSMPHMKNWLKYSLCAGTVIIFGIAWKRLLKWEVK